jgi:hypothetical protein
MKAKTISLTALALLPVALCTFTSCSSTSTPPPPAGSAVMTYKKGVPGEVLVQTIKVTATVTAIDQVKRKATLKGPDGKQFTVQVGRQAVNFDQVRVGDQVTATVTQKMAVTLEDKAASSGEGAAAVVVRAPEGGQPGGLGAETIQTTARITAIDVQHRKVTLQFEDGDTQTFSARPDTDLSQLRLGQRENIRVTEMIAIWVEKAQ